MTQDIPHQVVQISVMNNYHTNLRKQKKLEGSDKTGTKLFCLSAST